MFDSKNDPVSNSASSSSSSSGEALIYGTQQGDVECADETTMVACRGIPYAAPPVGDLRFADPRDPVVHTSTLNATTFGNICPQTAGTFGNTGSTTEDCLYLNIFKPTAKPESGAYPVMVWIHGGALIIGSGSEPGYDLPALVNDGVIVVTLNYRLGALGFLTNAALGDDSGNYGLKDQVQALRWIKANIASFDGNPDNVTIFGQSAGGHSVLSLLVSPVADEGLFHKAIVESGAYNPTQMSVAVARTAFYDHMVTALGCTGSDAEIRACLRGSATTVEKILAAQGNVWPLPTYGSTFLPQSIETALAGGNVAPVPVMLGSTLNEGTLFTALDIVGRYVYQKISYPGGGSYYETEDEYRGGGTSEKGYGVFKLLATDARVDGSLYTSIGDRYLANYATDANHRYRKALSDMDTDFRFACNSSRLVNYLTGGSHPIYKYWFTDTTSAALPSAPGGTPLTTSIAGILAYYAGVSYATTDVFSLGATHANEIPYVFGKVEARGGSADQIALSTAMTKYWTAFAKNGDPNYAGGVQWDPFTMGEFVLNLAATGPAASSEVDFDATHRCACWNGIWNDGNTDACFD
ncbi:MAG: carboxylesterase family protein [Desulfobacteraceae bacterium]|nr:carboxylesterase family protein [Desulfobacteraceae bacterium]